MKKIISKPTASFKSWLATYLTHEQMDQFLLRYTDSLEVLRIDQVKESIYHLQAYIKDIRSRHKLSIKKNQHFLKIVQHERAVIKACRKALKHARLDDLIVHPIDHDQAKPDYHVMNNNDLITLSEPLLDYLRHQLSITDKITWILKHKTISDKTLTRWTGIPAQQITAIKSGEQSPKEVKLGRAMRVAKHYDNVVLKRLVQNK